MVREGQEGEDRSRKGDTAGGRGEYVKLASCVSHTLRALLPCVMLHTRRAFRARAPGELERLRAVTCAPGELERMQIEDLINCDGRVLAP